MVRGALLSRSHSRHRAHAPPSPASSSAGPTNTTVLVDDGMLAECQQISRFLQRFVAEDEDGFEIESGLQISLKDADDDERLVHVVRFRCRSTDEMQFHVEQLLLGNPYKRMLVPDESRVQDTYDFFILLQEIWCSTGGDFFRVSDGLKHVVDQVLDACDEDQEPEDDEEEAEFTESESESESSSSSDDDEEEDESSTRGKKRKHKSSRKGSSSTTKARRTKNKKDKKKKKTSKRKKVKRYVSPGASPEPEASAALGTSTTSSSGEEAEDTDD